MVLEGTTVDLLLHIITLVAAAALFVVSLRAYRRKDNEKFLYICLAFGVFAVKEGIVTAEVLGLGLSILTGLSHVLNLVILALFFRGTVK
ncbi:MAG: hypothetical protein ABEJ36_05000 [Candidatus Nanosalina sp.]